MRVVLRKHSPTLGPLFPASRLLVAGAFVLAACQSEPTTVSDQSDDSTIEFELTPEAEAAAKTAEMKGMRKLKLLSARNVVDPGSSLLLAPPTINSPFDLTYFGGRVVRRATSYNVYLNCPTPLLDQDCWGTGTLGPGTFLRDLNLSEPIRLLNEYIAVDAKGRFPVVEMRINRSLVPGERLMLEDIVAILGSAVGRTGASGYSAIYHVFLREGTEMCIVEGDCYSPTDPGNFTFCAFHGTASLALSPGQSSHVLFTVEPYQAVDGCQLPGQTPHGVIDATASTLWHELAELITDPDLDGWFNNLFGFEVADMCSTFATNHLLNGSEYFIQSIYSNRQHNCMSQL